MLRAQVPLTSKSDLQNHFGWEEGLHFLLSDKQIRMKAGCKHKLGSSKPTV